MENFKYHPARDLVIIQLHEIKPKESQLEIPHFQSYETDGGKLSARVSNVKHSFEGSVLASSITADQKAKEDGIDFTLPVVVNPSARQDHYLFNPSAEVKSFDGLICIPYNLILANVTN